MPKFGSFHIFGEWGRVSGLILTGGFVGLFPELRDGVSVSSVSAAPMVLRISFRIDATAWLPSFVLGLGGGILQSLWKFCTASVLYARIRRDICLARAGILPLGLPRARNIVGKESGNAPRNAAFLSHSMRSFAGVTDWESTWAPACAVADGGRGGSQNLSTCGRLLFVAREKNSVGMEVSASTSAKCWGATC